MKRGLRSPPKSYLWSQGFIFGMPWYRATLIFSRNYYLTIQTFSEFISTKTPIFREFSKDNADFFRVHIYQSVYRILYTFQSSYKPILIFSKNYYQIIRIFQSSCTLIVIFSDRYCRNTHIFHSSYKPLLTNKTKIFIEL